MRAPYGLEIIEDCFSCSLREGRIFCDLPAEVLTAYEAVKFSTIYPKDAVLFVEGQTPRGVFVLCSGQAKLSMTSRDGKSLIVQIAEAGDLLGLSATVSGRPYEISAETTEPAQVTFVKREDFVKLLREHAELCFRIAQLLSNSYHSAFEMVRSLGLSQSAAEKLARLMLSWCDKNSNNGERAIQMKLSLTHEEIAQMIGTSRETVARLLTDFRNRQLITLKGSSLVIPDRGALEALVR